MRTLCAVHARRGPDYGVGLGFYAFLRFHIDTTKFRRWGADPDSTSCPPIIRAEDVASVYQPPVLPAASAPPAAAAPPTQPVVIPPPPVDDLAPAPAPVDTSPHRP
jgi:hypothetical protein